MITYKRAQKTRRVASTLPLSALVLETDAPDMPLSGFQGKRNSPDQLLTVFDCLSNLRTESRTEIARETCNNAKAVFMLN